MRPLNLWHAAVVNGHRDRDPILAPIGFLGRAANDLSARAISRLFAVRSHLTSTGRCV